MADRKSMALVDQTSTTSQFFRMLPREVRDEVYLEVLGLHAGLGCAGAFRVSHQFHDELVDTMLRNHVMILLVLRGASDLARTICPKVHRSGPHVKAFKHYTMRISITDKDCPNLVTRHCILPGYISFQNFMQGKVIMDDPEDAVGVPSFRHLSWLVDMKAPIAANKSFEGVLLEDMAEHMWQYWNVTIVNATDAASAARITAKIKNKRWRSDKEYAAEVKAICKLGAAAIREDNLDAALLHYFRAHRLITSCLRVNSSLLRQMKQSTYEAATTIADIYILFAQEKRLDRLQLVDGPDVGFDDLYSYGFTMAERSLMCLQMNNLPDEDHSKAAHAYYSMAVISKLDGKLDDAKMYIREALRRRPRDERYKREQADIKRTSSWS